MICYTDDVHRQSALVTAQESHASALVLPHRSSRSYPQFESGHCVYGCPVSPSLIARVRVSCRLGERNDISGDRDTGLRGNVEFSCGAFVTAPRLLTTFSGYVLTPPHRRARLLPPSVLDTGFTDTNPKLLPWVAKKFKYPGSRTNEIGR